MGPGHIGWLAAEHGPQPGWGWAQDASTVGGAAALLVYGVSWWRRHPPVGTPVAATAGLHWAAFAVIGLATLVGAGYGWRLVPDGPGTHHAAVLFAATYGLNAGLAVLALAAVALAVAAPQWTRLRARP